MISYIWRAKPKAAALVEMAIVLLLLLTITLGIIEFGMMMKAYLTLSDVAREGSRSASLGSPTGVVDNRIIGTISTLGLRSLDLTDVYLEYRTYARATGYWSSWTTLGNTADGTENNAPNNDTYESQVRVRLVYGYRLVTGSFFAPIIGQGGTVSLKSSMVMKRE